MSKLSHHSHRPSPSMVVALLALVIAASGAAFASIPDADEVFHGCYSNRTGALRMIDTEAGDSCTSKESPIFWNQEGPRGPAGADGEDGQDGQDGADGHDGDSLVGSQCELPNNTPGTIAIDVAADGTITFTCDTDGGGVVDADQDGWTSDVDCNDADSAINPGAIQIANGVDDNCGGALGRWFMGVDLGGCVQGVRDETTTAPYLSETVAYVGPVPEIADNEVDDNCDGQVDAGPFGEASLVELCNDQDDDLDFMIDELWPELGTIGPHGGIMQCSVDGSGTAEVSTP